MATHLPCLFQTLRRRASERGSVALEFALLAPPFFLLLMGMIEFFLMMGAQQLMESAAYNISRLAKTGYVSTGSTQSQTVSQLLVTQLGSYGHLIDTSKITMTGVVYDSFAGAASGGGSSGMGAPEQIVVYTISYPWELFTPVMSSLVGTGGIYTLNSTVVVRNEPY